MHWRWWQVAAAGLMVLLPVAYAVERSGGGDPGGTEAPVAATEQQEGERGDGERDAVSRAEERLAEAERLVEAGQAGPEELLHAQTNVTRARILQEVRELRELHAERLQRLKQLVDEDRVAVAWVDHQQERLDRLDLLLISLPSLLDSIATPMQ